MNRSFRDFRIELGLALEIVYTGSGHTTHRSGHRFDECVEQIVPSVVQKDELILFAELHTLLVIGIK